MTAVFACAIKGAVNNKMRTRLCAMSLLYFESENISYLILNDYMCF